MQSIEKIESNCHYEKLSSTKVQDMPNNNIPQWIVKWENTPLAVCKTPYKDNSSLYFD